MKRSKLFNDQSSSIKNNLIHVYKTRQESLQEIFGDGGQYPEENTNLEIATVLNLCKMLKYFAIMLLLANVVNIL